MKIENVIRVGWEKVKFGDVVWLNTERVADPLAAGIERYVGLEHLTPDDLHIRSWGNVADGTTFTNMFKPGQVLFGKRRAYQRKVALAEFSGICSGDIYVFETKDPNVLLPELLPFICQTEGFYQHAVGTSAGSLSPRTNWTQLAGYEFPLPPLDEQRRIADLLWALEATLSSDNLLKTNLFRVQVSLVEDFISCVNNGVPFKQLLTDMSYGSSSRANDDKNGIPILRIPNVLRNEIDLSDLKYVKLSKDEVERYSIKSGDILV